MVKPEPRVPRGTSASRKTNTPMPPIQWVKLRQYKRLLSRLSTSDRMEAPVVVKPETVSKKASIKAGISRDRKKGRAPVRPRTIQEMPAQARPSFS